ncbi:phenylacetic acid degradation protein PaaN [Azospirillum sp. 412522]|nr:phenylacetic acid degradation protein PaaN [Azospirillum sp. 412522]MBY6261852.1 phenylacetic acid degradation protein PaaN [Azospirillum sp. 412522]
MTTTPQALFETHEATLQKAMEACRSRAYWSAFPEMPSPRAYGETAAADGEAAFAAYRDKPFELDQPGVTGTAGGERSPFGFDLGITYPVSDVETLVTAAKAAMPGWRKAGPNGRAGVCLEILKRLNARSFEIANAVMHTTGQAFMMAFQAGAPHAQDRGLEAVAYGWKAMTDQAPAARWEKPQGKNPPLVMDKRFEVVGRGVGLVIGCATFPTWNGYPGLFASLVTGNAVIVKPGPTAILPLAITVRIAREVLAECGLDPNLVTLAIGDTVAKDLALRPEVAVIDYTGSTGFGDWLERNARHAQVYTEKAGVNSVVIDGTDDPKGMVRNLAFTLSLYSGQMCTTTQVIFVPKDGIQAGPERMSFDQVVSALAGGVDKFLSDPERAVEVLGAIQSDATLARIDEAAKLGTVVLPSHAIAHPKFPDARIRTPLILTMDAADEDKYGHELFGPITIVVKTDSTADSLERAARLTRTKGALTTGLYSTDPQLIEQATDLFVEAGVALSVNLTGGVFVNQSAAFSDFHGTGANPAANAALCDLAFVANRFRVVQSRVPVLEAVQ